MPENRDFSHLPLPFLYRGKPKLRGFNSPSERTNRNRNNRAHHGEYLKRRSSELSQFWKERRINRLEEDLPEIQVGIPILLEIEPSSNIEFLRGLGFEIVCEIEDGFIIVASEDIDLTRFNQKANEFIQNISLRCNTPAKVYALCEDSDRLKRILSDDLYSKWATISADSTYFMEKTFDALCNAARRCIEEDGAQCIVLSCLGMAGMGERMTNELKIPVIDPAPVAIKYAEMLAGLGICYSRKAYPSPPDKEII